MIKLHIIIKSCHMDGHSVHISIGNAIMGVLNLNSWHNNSILITRTLFRSSKKQQYHKLKIIIKRNYYKTFFSLNSSVFDGPNKIALIAQKSWSTRSINL